eukprot:CAMPEP_0198493074 /NCGR_PEP_ID=MMETSP1462-20131121/3798_1 /TAXON_ID=1333877 /ORGANISM="Brandtodinium nutriculum, Strain RCC3387" /LENGTH=92 /DNA_ID=CAMNT_0044221747 /DNA_START=56 /DNA_END=334 /DNA_ORIENTATION=-
MPVKDKKKREASRVEQAPPPCPAEWSGTVKGIVHQPGQVGNVMFLGSRTVGRSLCSPYNWPATNATPVHARTGADWESGGALYTYSRGVSTQ